MQPLYTFEHTLCQQYVKDIIEYTIVSDGVVSIDGMNAIVDFQTMTITPIFDEVIESDKVVVNSNVA